MKCAIIPIFTTKQEKISMDQEQREVSSEIMLFMEARPIYEHQKLGPQCHERIGDKHCLTVKTSSLCEAKEWETTHMKMN